MIECNFDPRTLANMNVVLDLVCKRHPRGEQYKFRKRVARALLRCAKSGKTTLGALTKAGEEVLTRFSIKPADRSCAVWSAVCITSTLANRAGGSSRGSGS